MLIYGTTCKPRKINVNFCRRFCRAMLCKRGLCHHAVSVHPSVRPSVCHVGEFCQNEYSCLQNFLPSGSQTILVFHTEHCGNVPWRPPPLTGASNAGGVGKNRELSRYLAPSHAVNASTAKCNTLSNGPWQVDDASRWWAAEFVDGGRRRRSVYDKKPYAKDNERVFNCTQRYI